MYRRHEQPFTRASNGQGVIYVNVAESVSQVECTLYSRCSGFRSIVTTNLNTVFFLDLSCIGSNESAWDHMDGESNFPPTLPATAHRTLGSVGLHWWGWMLYSFTKLLFSNHPMYFTLPKLVCYRKQTFTFSILLEAISLFLNAGVSSVFGTKQALHSGNGFRYLWLFSRYQTITNIETLLTV
jgi:hypothetical protein